MKSLPIFSKPHAINLLARDPFEKSFGGHLLSWMLRAGKWTVIITELIVVIAFVSRFGMDRKLTDLHKQISREVASIQSYGELEDKFLTMQKRLAFLEPVLDANEKTIGLIETISRAIPADVWLSKLSISPDGVTLEASALSITGFGQFLQTLEKDGSFSKISVNNVNSDSASGGELKFTLTMERAKSK